MRDSTPLRNWSTWLQRVLDKLDRRIFLDDDARAAARGWEIRRPRRFTRTYRDPRWNTVSACPDCSGTGMDATRACSRCRGNGVLRDEPDGVGAPSLIGPAARPWTRPRHE